MKKWIMLLYSISLVLANNDINKKYSCNLFKSALNSFQTINIKAQNPKVCGNPGVSANTYNDPNNYLQCSLSENECSNLQNCVKENPPKNRYSANFFDNDKNKNPFNDNTTDYELKDTNYTDYSFNNDNINIKFNPQYEYEDENKKYMVLGSYTFSGNKDTLTFEPGDYYFEQLTFNGNNINITLPDGGPVRIFIKNDLTFNKNNIFINKDGDSDNLFIYVGGNFNLGSSGGGEGPKINGYFYIKGDANLRADSNNFVLKGALTSEGNINVNGNGEFDYIESKKLGYGKCNLCYALNDGGTLIGFADFINAQFNFPRTMAIINNSGESLKDTNVSQIEDTSGFSGNMACYSVVDENNKNINKKITVKVNGIGVGYLNRVTKKYCVIDKGDTNTTAEFGDYESGGFEHYLAIKTEGFSNQFLGNEDVKYFATYYDEEGRLYKDVQLDYCNIPSSPKHNYSTGPFDAWDTFRTVFDRNISTKIVNKDFYLKLGVFKKNRKDVSKSIADCEYRLYDMNNDTNITDWKYVKFNAYSGASFPIVKFNIDKAYKNVRVNFKFCQQKDPQGNIQIVPLSVCREHQNSNVEYNISTYSSDEFAIRPDKFEIKVDTTSPIKAGDKFNIDFSALGYDGSYAKDYNETVGKTFEVNVSENKTGCIIGTFDKDIKADWQFADGDKIINTSYSEVGDINISIKELPQCDEKFAAVDCDDRDIPEFWNKEQDLPIKENNVTLRFIPAYFNVNSNLINYENTYFTYLSKDLNMSAMLDLNITVENENNKTTLNYDRNCYANDVNISIAKILTPFPNTLKHVLYIYNVNDKNSSEYNVSIDDNISVNSFSKDYFTKGFASLKIYINFDRSSSKPENAFYLKIDKIDVKDTDVNKSLSNCFGEANYVYGRIYPVSASSIGREVNTSFIYDYWNYNKGWVVNKVHTLELGKVYFDKSYVNNTLLTDSDINYTAKDISSGIQKVTFKTNHHFLPYGVKLHLSISSWLWYHPLAKDYKDPSSDNLDCLTHPCLRINFLNDSKGWGGIDTNNIEIKKEFNESKRTMEINVSKINIDKKEYRKIDW
jgi:hypothetical protein